MQTSSYLNDVNFLSAVVPNFKLLAVASDVFRDPDSAHLETGTPNGDHSDATVDPPAANVYLPRLVACFCFPQQGRRWTLLFKRDPR